MTWKAGGLELVPEFGQGRLQRLLGQQLLGVASSRRTRFEGRHGIALAQHILESRRTTWAVGQFGLAGSASCTAISQHAQHAQRAVTRQPETLEGRFSSMCRHIMATFSAGKRRKHCWAYLDGC